MNDEYGLTRNRNLGGLRKSHRSTGPSHLGKIQFHSDLIKYLFAKSQSGTHSVECHIAGWEGNKSKKNPKDQFLTIEISDPHFTDKSFFSETSPPPTKWTPKATLDDFILSNYETDNF